MAKIIRGKNGEFDASAIVDVVSYLVMISLIIVFFVLIKVTGCGQEKLENTIVQDNAGAARLAPAQVLVSLIQTPIGAPTEDYTPTLGDVIITLEKDVQSFPEKTPQGVPATPEGSALSDALGRLMSGFIKVPKYEFTTAPIHSQVLAQYVKKGFTLWAMKIEYPGGKIITLPRTKDVVGDLTGVFCNPLYVTTVNAEEAQTIHETSTTLPALSGEDITITLYYCQ